MKKVKLFLVLGLVAFGLNGCIENLGLPPLPTLSSATANAESTNTESKGEKVKASQIYDDCSSNRLAAKEKWKGKWITATGEVSSIGEAAGVLYISIKDGNSRFMFYPKPTSQNINKAYALKNGQTITLSGKIFDFGGFCDTISVTDSEIGNAEPTKVEPANGIKSAKTLATQVCSEYNANNVAANREWIGKNITVRGAVSQVDEKADHIAVVLDFQRMEGHFRFVFKPTKQNIDKISTLKQGQAVTLSGKVSSIGKIFCNVIVDNSSF